MRTIVARTRRKPRLPQLERETPLIALAAAQAVLEEASLAIGQPLPARFAARIAHQARRAYAHSPQFRRKLQARGNDGRDWLFAFLRHWLTAQLHAERFDLFLRLPSGFAIGNAIGGQRKDLAVGSHSGQTRLNEPAALREELPHPNGMWVTV